MGKLNDDDDPLIMIHTPTEDIDTACRLCLSRGIDNVQIFSFVGEKYKLRDKIFKQFSIRVKLEKGIPKAICPACLSQVNKFHCFSEMVNLTQTKIQAITVGHSATSREVLQDPCQGETFLDGASSKNVQAPQITGNVTSGVVNYTPFPVDFNTITPLEFSVNCREPLSNADVYRTGTRALPASTNDCCDESHASTSKLEMVSTEIEVVPDVDNYMNRSTDDSDIFESPPPNFTGFVRITSPELSLLNNCVNQVTPYLQGIKSVLETKPKHDSSTGSEVDAVQARHPDAFSVLDQRSLNIPLRSEVEEGELIQHPLGCNEKSPRTKLREARLEKSLKVKEQLENFYQHVCNYCNGNPKFIDFQELQKHCQDVHKTNAFVSCCDRQFWDRKTMIHHMQTRHLQPNEYTCPQCGKSVSTPHMLKLHIINHLPESERPFKCSQCGKGFCSFAYVRKHERSRHLMGEPAGTFSCDVCGKAFSYERKLLVHKRNIHSKFQELRYRSLAYQAGTSSVTGSVPPLQQDIPEQAQARLSHESFP